MIYYKYNSMPLEEDTPGIGQSSFDEYGNYVEINAFGEPQILRKSVLNDGEKINEYEDICFLKAFWAMTKNNLQGYDIQDATE